MLYYTYKITCTTTTKPVDHDIVMTRQEIYMWKYDTLVFCCFLRSIPASSLQVCLKQQFCLHKYGKRLFLKSFIGLCWSMLWNVDAFSSRECWTGGESRNDRGDHKLPQGAAFLSADVTQVPQEPEGDPWRSALQRTVRFNVSDCIFHAFAFAFALFIAPHAAKTDKKYFRLWPV